MKNIANYITERLRINKDTKHEATYYLYMSNVMKRSKQWCVFGDKEDFETYVKEIKEEGQDEFIDSYEIPADRYENEVHFKFKYNEVDRLIEYCKKNHFPQIKI